MKFDKNMKRGFLSENLFLYSAIFYQILILLKFLKISYVLL